MTIHQIFLNDEESCTRYALHAIVLRTINELPSMGDLKSDLVLVLKGAEDETGSVMQYPTQYVNQDPYLHQDDDQQQGWVSWAWSFVPAIVSYDDEENESSGTDDGTTLRQQKSQSLKDPIISIGFYCSKATVTFKVRISLSFRILRVC